MAVSGLAERLLTRLSDTFKAEFRPAGVLGEGAMGVVISAEQAKLERTVAIKFLLCFSDPDALNRFGREAQLSSLLDHPRIVRLFTSGVDGELPYLVYEFVRGKTLRDVIAANGPIPPAQALAFARQLLEGLEHAHGRAIVHRDLKPANLLVSADGGLKIADYGIGSSLTIEWALTRTGTLMGTPAYMAPEQWSAVTTVAADIYAAGVVLLEMLLGRNPFVRKTLIATRNAHVHDPRPPLGEPFDPRIDDLLDAMLAKVPAARPDATACLARLEEIQARRAPRRDATRPPPRGIASRAGVPAALDTSGGAGGAGPGDGAAPGGAGGAGPGDGAARAGPGGAGESSSGVRLRSIAPGGAAQVGGARRGLTAAIALVIFLLGLLPFLRARAGLAGAASAVAGSRAAVLTVECDRPAQALAAVEPAVPGLVVRAVDRDGARRRWTVTLAGLEPGVSYRVQPLVDGRPAGPPVPVTTLGGPDQLASVSTLRFADAHTLAVRFRSPLLIPAALAVSSTLPSEWVSGAPGEVREVRVSGLDPARSYEPVLLFDGLPETVPLGTVPGLERMIESAHRALSSGVGGPTFADRQGFLKRLGSRAQKRVVAPERVRETIERYVRETTGLALDLVRSSAEARALDESQPLRARWRAREVLDGLMALEAIGHPWCASWVLDLAAQRPLVPKWEWVGKVPRPPEAPAFVDWVPAGPVRDYVGAETLPLWTHRDRNLDSVFMLNNAVADSYAIETKLAKNAGWAWLTPPAPPDRNANVELVLKLYNLTEDQTLWLRFGPYTLAVPGSRGARPLKVVSIVARKAEGLALRVTIPAEIWRETQGIEVRLDGFQATENAPVADECWIADAWLIQ